MKKHLAPIVASSHFLFVASCLLFLLLLHTLPFEPSINIGLSILIFIGTLWLTEAIHITVTALLVPILAVIFHVFDTQGALSHFAHPIIYQFLGGMILASALCAQELDKAMANKIFKLTKGRMPHAILVLFCVTAFLSMWISNIATISMMTPLVLGVLANIDATKEKRTYIFALLGTAYSASIGGIATLVGTAPNAIAAAAVELDFNSWMFYGLPISLILLPIVIGALYIIIRPNLNYQLDVIHTTFKWNTKKIVSLIIFVTIVSMWIFGRQLSQFLGGINNIGAVIGLLAAALVCIFKITNWKDIQRNTDWGILLLFGGGLCLSAILRETGASDFLAESVAASFLHMPLYLSLLIVSLFIVFLTEFASNTATAALFIPILISIATHINLSPATIAALTAIATSCAFMLPAATPPNAFVYGTGHIPLKKMIRAGFIINFIVAIALSTFAYFIWI